MNRGNDPSSSRLTTADGATGRPSHLASHQRQQQQQQQQQSKMSLHLHHLHPSTQLQFMSNTPPTSPTSPSAASDGGIHRRHPLASAGRSTDAYSAVGDHRDDDFLLSERQQQQLRQQQQRYQQQQKYQQQQPPPKSHNYHLASDSINNYDAPLSPGANRLSTRGDHRINSDFHSKFNHTTRLPHNGLREGYSEA